MLSFLATLCVVLLWLPAVSSHIALFHPSMWGFNATDNSPFSGNGVPGEHDNRPVVPLMNRTFDQWWFHGYFNYPPPPDQIMQFPAGGTKTVELACHKAFTSYWNQVSPTPYETNDPCPGQSHGALHTTGINDLGGCALAIAYESDATLVKPEDFTVFSVNQTCVWTKDTDFQVPANMPSCPNGKCTCAWFWLHTPDGGSEQNYMISFQCNVANATGTVPVAKGNPARRCGEDSYLNRPADPANCTVGARAPIYWFQFEGNNFFEDAMTPPLYTKLYGWEDGAQNDIFRSVPFGTDPNSTTVTSSSIAPTATSTSPRSPATATPSGSTGPTPTSSISSQAPSDGICVRPGSHNSGSGPQSKLSRLADALGLGQLRRRRNTHSFQLRKRS